MIHDVIRKLQAVGFSDIEQLPSEHTPLFAFTRPGDRTPGLGRAAVRTMQDTVKIWHNGLSRKWLDGPMIESALSSGRWAAVVRVSDIEQLKIAMPAPAVRVNTAPMISQEEILNRAVSSLLAQGLVYRGKSQNFLLMATNGAKQSAHLKVHDGYAALHDFKGDIQLDEPWKRGRDDAAGNAVWIATASDLLGREIKDEPVRTIPSVSLEKTTDADRRELYVTSYDKHVLTPGLMEAPADHRHLNKNVMRGKPLSPENLFVTKDGQYKGAIVIPMYAGEAGSNIVSMVGAQVLLSKEDAQKGTDKMLLPGSRLAGAFAPVPFAHPSEMTQDVGQWVASISKDKPIVLCEGAMTALAVHQSGAGHAVCCFSSSNLVEVARFFAERGLHEIHGIVVAADNDIGLHRDGRLRSQGVLKAIEAARMCDGEVAFMGRSRSPGFDARDLYAAEGPAAVEAYINNARKSDEVEHAFRRVIERRAHELGLDR
jgi:hypothetical protein